MDYSHTNPLIAPDEVAPWLRSLRLPIAVTGGTGFVGSHLIDTLCAAGIEPRVLVRAPDSPRWIARAPVTWVRGSLDEPQTLARLVDGVGTVLHLAGVVRAGSAAAFFRANRDGTANLVRAMDSAAAGARLVHVSSLAAAGPSPRPDGLSPDAEPAPVSAYGRSKLAGEREVSALDGGRQWLILRPPAIFGPRDTDVFEFFKMAQRGVVLLPSGERWLTVAWVGDVVRAVIAAASRDGDGRIFHLGSPDPVLMGELVRELAKSGGRSPKVVRVPVGLVRAAGDVGSLLQMLGMRRVALTRDKARELLACHWTARTRDSLIALGVGQLTEFADGAAATWAWYRRVGWL